jgi:hypothetical protein
VPKKAKLQPYIVKQMSKIYRHYRNERSEYSARISLEKGKFQLQNQKSSYEKYSHTDPIKSPLNQRSFRNLILKIFIA